MDRHGRGTDDQRCDDDRTNTPPHLWNALEVEITIDDPKAYTRPWTVKLNQELMLDTELIDEVCLENEKSWRHMQTPDTAK